MIKDKFNTALNNLIAQGYVETFQVNGEYHVRLTLLGKQWVENSKKALN